MKTLVLASARNERPYLLEWIAYHQAIGFDGVQIVTNDCTDGTDALLDALSRLGEIDHIDNTMGAPHENIQVRGYSRALESAFFRAFDWVCVLDIDEFLTPKKHATVQELIASYAGVDSIAVDRLEFGASGRMKYEPGLVMDRFTRCAAPPYKTGNVKSISQVKAIRAFAGAHYPNLLAGSVAVRGSGEPVVSYRDASKIDFSRAQVNHYGLKSYEEFCAKRARGNGVTLKSDKYTDNYFWAYNFNDRGDHSILRFREKTLERLARLNQLVGGML